jgi:magnesium and cobalt exporter, CNNM family
MVRELFEFGDLTAREAMVPRVNVGGIPLNATPEIVRSLVSKTPHTRYPVFDGDLDHIVGVVHIKDLLRLSSQDAAVTPNDVRPIPYVPETMPLDAVLGTLRGQYAQMAVVLDEHGGTAGVITLEDLFEEVAGEIAEGAQPPRLFRDGMGRLHAAGTVRIEEVGEALDIVLEHPDVDSVSGLVMTLLGHPPEVGDAVEYDHVRFEVVSVDRHAVRECLVTPVKSPDEEDER